MSETLDTDLNLIAEAQASMARVFAYKLNGTLLDWTEESIQLLELMADRIHDGSVCATLKELDVTPAKAAKLMGWYLGEVYRRNNGGHWQSGQISGSTHMPCVTCPATSSAAWPLIQARNRIENGVSFNLWSYYQSLPRST